MKNDFLRLYIHIPFCLQKCGYCDFLSFSSDKDKRSLYISALKNEIRTRLREKMREKAAPVRIASVFFGGGTPTVLSGEELAGILEEIRRYAAVDRDAEITTEANPCTIDEDKMRILREAGFNRASIGAQSMKDESLKILGRIHDKKTFYRAYECAVKAGFDNLNLDLISGLPGQTAGEWERELNEAAALGSKHISVYSLEMYEGTPLYEDRDQYVWPTEDELAEMYERTADILSGYGLRRYEISNYARPGFESRHNTGYWTGDDYAGFGLGAASFENGVRFTNTASLSRYLRQWTGTGDGKCPDGPARCGSPEDFQKSGPENFGDAETESNQEIFGNNGSESNQEFFGNNGPENFRENVHKLTKEELETEYMILGLRLTKGVSLSGFRERFGESAEEVFGGAIEKYVNTGYLEEEGGRLRLARKALFVSNGILADFM